MIRQFFNRLYGTSVVFAHMRGQGRVPYLPRETLQELRDKRFRNIVRYAADTVPYYRDLFRKESIDPRDIRGVGDLKRLPLIDKETVRGDPHLFLSTSRKGRTAIPFVTSGSTNSPAEFRHDRHSLLANIAYGEREREVIRKTCGRALGYREAYIIPKSTRTRIWDFYREMTYIPVRPERLLLPVFESVERNVEAINRFRPDIIISFGSYLEALFRTLSLLGLQMHVPRGVVCIGDGVTGEGKDFIEEKFGIPVLARYNAGEAFKIGFSCEQRRGFHIHEDLCHVRIVNAAGEETAKGERGEVVISNLVNRGTVLLNYRLGDLASMPGEACPCGRTLPLLSELEGRIQDVIFQPNGTFIHPDSVLRVFKGRNGVVQYQLIQHQPERFELRLVTVDRDAYQRAIGGILGDLQALLGKTATIDARYCHELQRHRGGKFRPVLSLCKPKENDVTCYDGKRT